MNGVLGRVGRLEKQFAPADWKPRNYSLLVVTTLNHPTGLANAIYKADLCPNGTVMEIVTLRHRTRQDLTDEEWEGWLAETCATWNRENVKWGARSSPQS